MLYTHTFRPPAFPPKNADRDIRLSSPTHGAHTSPRRTPKTSTEPRLVAPKGGRRPDLFFGQSAHRVQHPIRQGPMRVRPLFPRGERGQRGIRIMPRVDCPSMRIDAGRTACIIHLQAGQQPGMAFRSLGLSFIPEALSPKGGPDKRAAVWKAPLPGSPERSSLCASGLLRHGEPHGEGGAHPHLACHADIPAV